MADSELQDLTEDTAPSSAAIVYIVEDPTGTPLSRYMTLVNALKAITNLTADTTWAAADQIAFYDNDAATADKITIPDFLEAIEDGLAQLSATPADTDSFLVIDGGVAKFIQYSDLGIGSGGSTALNLPIAAAHLPDDTSGSAAAQIQIKTTSDANDPQARFVEALFDATTEEHIYFQFVMPDNYSSAPILDVYYKATSATTGTAAFNCVMRAVSDGDAADVDAMDFAAENTAGTATVPGTAGHMDVISITISNADSVAAGDFVVLGVFRDVSADGVTGDLEVVQCRLRYTGA